MKRLVSIVFIAFISFNAIAQKTSKWVDKKATEVSQEMKEVLSLTDEQTAKMYDEEVKKILAIDKAKKENGGKKPTKENYKLLIEPYITAQTEIAGGKKKMNKYWAYTKEKRAKKQAQNK